MKYKGVLIVGYDNTGALKKEVIGLYEAAESRGYLVIGGHNLNWLGGPIPGFKLEDIRVQLEGKIDQDTRIDIIAHGSLNSVGDHRIGNLRAELINTRDLLQAINLCSPEPKNIHICSCLGGTVIKDIEVLTPGSFLACYASEDEFRFASLPLNLIKRLLQDPSPNVAELMFKFFGYYVGNDARFATKKRDGTVEFVNFDLDIGEILSSDRSDLLVREKFNRLFKELGPDLPQFILTDEQRRKLESDDIEDFLSLFSSDPVSAVKDVIIPNLDMIINDGFHYLMQRKDGIVRIASMTKKEISDLERHFKVRIIDLIFRYYPDIDENLLRLYLEKAINIDNALTQAIESGRANIINTLLPFVTDATDITNAIKLATNKGNIEIVRKIIEATTGEVSLEHKKFLGEALIEALLSYKTEVALALIEVGADLKIRDSKGNNALIYAANQGNIEIVKKIIAVTAGEGSLEYRNFLGEALIKALIGYRTEVALELIEAGADLQIRDSKGNNALMYAANQGNIEIVRKIIAVTAGEGSLDHKEFLGEALIKALIGYRTEVALELIEAGADLQIKGGTALEYATRFENYAVCWRINGDKYIVDLKDTLDTIVELKDSPGLTKEQPTERSDRIYFLLKTLPDHELQKFFSDEKYLNALDELGKKILKDRDVYWSLRPDEIRPASLSSLFPPTSKASMKSVMKILEKNRKTREQAAGLGKKTALPSSDSSGGAGSGPGAGCGAGMA